MSNLKKILAASFLLALFGAFFFLPDTTRAQGNAAQVYKQKCAICHAPDGSGNCAYGKANKLRDLRSAAVQSQSDAVLLDIIAKGKGTSPKMPGYEKSLGIEGCKAQVAYIRSIKM
jgi:mono/diheme cytochrome c family protein